MQVRLGEKKADQICEYLGQIEKTGVIHIIYSLGIKHIGTQTARVIASRVEDIDGLISATLRKSAYDKNHHK